jgi:hypothetical protein
MKKGSFWAMQVIKKIIDIIKDLNLASTILLHAPDYTGPELRLSRLGLCCI